MNLQLQLQQQPTTSSLLSMTTFSTKFLSHTLNFRIHPNRTSCHSESSTPLLNEGNPNKRRTRINQEKISVNETRPKLDQNYDFRDTNSTKALNRLCKLAKYDEALYMLQLMVNGGYKPHVIPCTQLINGFFCSKKIEKAIQVMEILEKHGKPDVLAYNTVINLLCKADRVDAANKVFDRMKKRGILPNVVTYNIRLKSLLNQGKWEAGESLISDMLDKGIDPNMITYNSLISWLCRDGLVDQAIELMVVMMESRKFQPTVISYNAVILGLCKVRRIIDAIEVLAVMNQSGCLPNEKTYKVLILGIGFGGWRNIAMELANSLVNMDAISEDSFKGLNKAFFVFDAHKELAISE